MRPITFILCATAAEAARLAADAKLDNWRWLGDEQPLRGMSAPTVWQTKCWFYGRTREARHEIRMQLAMTEAVIKRIDCLHGGRIVAAEPA